MEDADVILAAVADANNDVVHDADDDAELDDATAIQTLLSILCEKEEFPAQQRNGTIANLARTFIRNFKMDIHDMITDGDFGNYRGLDSTRDTEAEVEKVLRIFPDLLSKRKTTKLISADGDGDDHEWVETDEDDGEYPIQCLPHAFSIEDGKYICNEKAVPFIHLFAQLAIEFNSFDDKHRGGILIEDDNGGNVLEYLTKASTKLASNHDRQRVDRIFLTQMIRLRQSDLLTKQDVQKYRLTHNYEDCHYDYFPNARFQFLTEWDPMSLIPTNSLEIAPLFFAANDMRSFRVVFEAGIRCFPKKNGIHLLFGSIHYTLYKSPFERICATFKQKDVMEVVEDVLSRYSTTALLPENIMEPLLSACTDARIHLNCVYFLLRRVPTVLSGFQLPSSRRRLNIHNDNTRRNNKETSTDNENTDAGDKEKDNHDVGSTTDTSHHNGKRKRNEDLIG